MLQGPPRCSRSRRSSGRTGGPSKNEAKSATKVKVESRMNIDIVIRRRPAMWVTVKVRLSAERCGVCPGAAMAD